MSPWASVEGHLAVHHARAAGIAQFLHHASINMLMNQPPSRRRHYSSTSGGPSRRHAGAGDRSVGLDSGLATPTLGSRRGLGTRLIGRCSGRGLSRRRDAGRPRPRCGRARYGASAGPRRAPAGRGPAPGAAGLPPHRRPAPRRPDEPPPAAACTGRPVPAGTTLASGPTSTVAGPRLRSAPASRDTPTAADRRPGLRRQPSPRAACAWRGRSEQPQQPGTQRPGSSAGLLRRPGQGSSRSGCRNGWRRRCRG